MTVCHCLCAVASPAVMTVCLPNDPAPAPSFRSPTGSAGPRDVDKLNTFPAGVSVGVGSRPGVPRGLGISAADGMPGWEGRSLVPPSALARAWQPLPGPGNAPCCPSPPGASGDPSGQAGISPPSTGRGLPGLVETPLELGSQWGERGPASAWAGGGALSGFASSALPRGPH